MLDAPKPNELAVVTGAASPLLFCDDPKLKPPELAVVVGAACTAFPLKLNPMPLAVVVSGFCMKETVLMRFPESGANEEIPEIPELTTGATETVGLAPKLNGAAACAWKLKDGGAVVVTVEATGSAGAEVTAFKLLKLLKVDVEVPKEKPLLVFGVSLLGLPKEKALGVVEAPNEMTAGGTELEVGTREGTLEVTAGLATGVKDISDLLGSIEAGLSGLGVEKADKGDTKLEVVVAAGVVMEVDGTEVAGIPN